MRINIAIPEEHVSKPVLDGALEAVTRLNEDMIAKGKSPTSEQLIARGAKWQGVVCRAVMPLDVPATFKSMSP